MSIIARYRQTRPRLKLKTRTRFHPVSLSLSMSAAASLTEKKRFNTVAARPVSTTKIWARNGSPETPTLSKRATRDDRYKTLFIVDGVATFGPTTLYIMTLRMMG
jgi:hypothetical protein